MGIRFKNVMAWKPLEKRFPGAKLILKELIEYAHNRKINTEIKVFGGGNTYGIFLNNKRRVDLKLCKENSQPFIQCVHMNIEIKTIKIMDLEQFKYELKQIIKHDIELICTKKASNERIRQVFRNGIYSIEDVLSKRMDVDTPREEARVDFNGDLVYMNSHRYELFAEKGLKCVKCGIEGKYFVKEKFHINDPYHFNLYAVDENGREVLMTKDHILPKSKGGITHISNHQTMCTHCNLAKGNKLE